MTKTFAEQYQRLMDRHPEGRSALITKDKIVSFGELRKTIGQYRSGLVALGITSGARMAVSLPNSPEALYLAFAMSDLGGCLVPLHPATPPPFASHILSFCRAQYLVVLRESPLMQAPDLPCQVIPVDVLEAAQHGTGEEIPPPEPSSLALIISTSGTLARPKFVPVTQANLATVIDGTRALIAPMADFDEGLIYILGFPLSSSGIMPTMAQLALGGTYVLTDNLSPSHFLSLLEKWHIDGMQCPPVYLEKLVLFPDIARCDLRSVTRLNSGTDFVPNKLLLQLKERFRNLTHVGIGYGLAETCTMVLYWTAHHPDELKMSTNILTVINPDANEVAVTDESGTPMPVGESGEIRIRGASVIDGYYQNPELTLEAFDADGWLRTGDVGTLRDDGKIELLGRNKHTIKRGGHTISPMTVSNTLMAYPGVALVAVVGIPHPLFGEMVFAFIKTEPDAHITEGMLNAFCRKSLPPYLKPDHMVFLPELPRTPGAGKIDCERLKQIGAEKLKEMTGDNDE